MKKIKFGVVGTVRGITFIKLAQAFGDDVCLYAVCETDAKRAEATMQEIPSGARIFDDYDEFLDCGINAVVLCNFFHEHAAFAIKAPDKGIHVISDTTAAPTLGDCVALCRAVERSTAKYMLGANGPYKRALQFIRKEIRNGKLGTPFYAEAEYLHWSPNSKPYADDDMHWRHLMPGTYYNMHTLSSLMYVTETMRSA